MAAAARELFVAVVRQAAHALERALVVDEERAARATEEVARRRAELTATIVSSLESVRGFQPRLQALARHIAAFGDWCLVDLQGGDEVIRVADTRQLSGQADAEVVASYPSRARDPATTSIEAGITNYIPVVPPELVDDVAHDGRHRDALMRLGLGSLATAPFRLNAETLRGAITLVSRRPGEIGEADVELLVAIAAAVAPPLERERARDRERRIAATLQERLLPKVLTSACGMLVAHRYQAGVDDLLVGGDWIDTIPLADGRLGLVVGDVVGRGVEAAATMGQLRAALVALALDGSSPAKVLTKLDDYVSVNPSGRSTAVVYAIADPSRGELCYSCAGHLPPLVVDSGRVAFAAGGQGGPLGVWHGERDECVVTVDVGTTIVMFTDGLVERRGERLDVGLARVEAVASKLTDLIPEELCAGLLNGVFRGETPHDDVAVLAAQFCDPATTFLYRVPAYPRLLREVRHALRDWLLAAGLEGPIVDDIVLACGEACSNVVEHAYCDVPTGELALEAHAGERAVVCTVRDFGRWRAAGAVRPGGRGFGLIGELVDELDVQRTPWGTTVRLRRDRSL
jgi:serine phosphatase RsbU (regulator of sigma subunit)/anti-sigma regulatory factor (Ser/Thr protein kinase)